MNLSTSARSTMKAGLGFSDVSTMKSETPATVQKSWQLSQYGSASILQQTASRHDLAPIGSPLWSAPEVFSASKIQGIEADVWSFGVILLEAVSRRPPFDGMPIEAIPLLVTQVR